MGYLERGVWRDAWYDARGTGGEFVRRVAKKRTVAAAPAAAPAAPAK